MKKTVVSIAAVLLLICGIVISNQQANAAGAKIVADETNFNYGYIPAESVVSHSFFFKASGTDSLKILNVKPGCGCTKAPLKKDVVAVGDSAEVELIFTASKYKGDVAKSATVTCNDSDRANFQLLFRGKVYDRADSLAPLSLSTGIVDIDPAMKSKGSVLKIKNVTKMPLTLKPVDVPAAYLKVELPKGDIKPGTEKEIKVEIPSSVTETSFKKSFTFETTDSAQTRYTVAVVMATPADKVQISAPPATKQTATAGSMPGKK